VEGVWQNQKEGVERSVLCVRERTVAGSKEGVERRVCVCERERGLRQDQSKEGAEGVRRKREREREY
jgi:hypothetical protein